jgi:hypothetical protein
LVPLDFECLLKELREFSDFESLSTGQKKTWI